MEIDRHEDEKRWIERRSSYLRAQYDLSDRDAAAEVRSVYVALSELGYSREGIAGHPLADSGNKSTVASHLNEVEEKFGAEAIYACRPDQLGLEVPMGALEPEE